MKNWAIERDRVVKQALSFVETAAAAAAPAKRVTQIAQPSDTAAPHPTAPPAMMAQPITPAPIISEQVDRIARPVAEATAPKVDSAPPHQDRPKLSERAEILMRVNAFKNFQIKVRREREEYYEATLAKTRAALGRSTAARTPD
jgi:hypothetical protein